MAVGLLTLLNCVDRLLGPDTVQVPTPKAGVLAASVAVEPLQMVWLLPALAVTAHELPKVKLLTPVSEPKTVALV